MSVLVSLFTRKSLESPWKTIILWLVMAGLAGFFVVRIPLATSNLDLLNPNDDVTKNFLSFGQKFGSPNAIFLGIWGGSLTQRHQEIDRIIPQIKGLDDVSNVFGRINMPEEVLEVLGMDPYLDSTQKDMNLVIIQPEDVKTEIHRAAALVNALRNQIHLESPLQWDLTGIPVYALNDRTFIKHDISRYSILGLLGVALLVIFGFRSLLPPIAAVASLLVSIVLTAGIIYFVPGRLTLLSASFATLLLGLGIDSGVHVIHRVEQLTSPSTPMRTVILQAISEIAPGLLTGTLTTGAVFLTLLATDFLGFQELGLISTIGMIVAFLVMISLLPAILVVIPFKVRPGNLSDLQARTVGSHPLSALFLVVPFLVFLFGIPAFDSNYLNLQPPNSPAVQLERRIFSSFDVSSQFAGFTVKTADQAEALTQKLQVMPDVKQVLSLNDFELLKDEGFQFDIPKNLGRLLIDSKGERAVYAYPEGNVWEVEKQEKFYEDMIEIDPNVTGMPILGHIMLKKTQRALWVSGILSAFVVFLLVGLTFKKVTWTLLAMLPVILTVISLPALMSMFRLSLNPINVMAVPVILGIAVDDGVHFVHRLVLENGAVNTTMLRTGKSILITSLTNLAAFGCLVLSSHRGLQSFAGLLCLGVGFALITSLTLLPWASSIILRKSNLH